MYVHSSEFPKCPALSFCYIILLTVWRSKLPLNPFANASRSSNTWPQILSLRSRVVVFGLYMFECTIAKRLYWFFSFFPCERTNIVHQFLIWLSLCVYWSFSSFSCNGSHLVLQWESNTIHHIIYIWSYTKTQVQ